VLFRQQNRPSIFTLDEGEYLSSFFLLTLQEQEDKWINFWTIHVDPIMNKHKQYEWLIRSWIVVGIFLCTALLAILVRDDGHGRDDHVALWIVSAIAMGLVVLLWRASSYPKSCQGELVELCIRWSHDQKQKQKPLVEARFFEEHGPPTNHGRNALGVFQFLPLCPAVSGIV
jgi:hypothetical protein